MHTKIFAVLALSIGAVTSAMIPAELLPRAQKCNKGVKVTSAGGHGPHSICYSYCEHTSKRIVGNPRQVGPDISCDTASCADQHSQTYTSTESFDISIGLTVDSNAGEEEVLKGGASVGANWSWSTSKAVSNSFTFTLKKGDKGHVVFRPYFHQSCGDMKYFGYKVNGDDTTGKCDTTPAKEDKNACGQTPLLLNGFADGEFTFCYTAGAKKGKGC